MKIRFHILLLLALPLVFGAAALPRSGPVPEQKPAEDNASEAQPPQAEPSENAEPLAGQPDPATDSEADIPTPEPKPDTADEDAAPRDDAAGIGKEDDGKTGDQTPADDKDKDDTSEKTEPPPPPVEKEDPEALKACLADLAALGTKFKTAARIDDGQGCGIDQPLEVAEAVPGIDTGGAQMRCETARALGHSLKDTVQPTLKIAMPDKKITGITTGSTYACRLRNSASTGKISEHARGNAIDVAAFTLDDGSEITMKPRHEDGTMEGAFQRTVTAGACLHFSTVLSPGSDAAHQDHLHMDVLERDSGYRYCR